MSKSAQMSTSQAKLFNGYLQLSGMTCALQVAEALDVPYSTARSWFSKYAHREIETNVVPISSKIARLRHDSAGIETNKVLGLRHGAGIETDKVLGLRQSAGIETPPIYKERAHPTTTTSKEKETYKEKEVCKNVVVDKTLITTSAKSIAGDLGTPDVETVRIVDNGQVAKYGADNVSSAIADLIAKIAGGSRPPNPLQMISIFAKQAASRPQSAAATGKSVEDRSPKKDQISTLQSQSDPIQEMRQLVGKNHEGVEKHLARLSVYCLSRTPEADRPKKAAEKFVDIARKTSVIQARAAVVKLLQQVEDGGRAPQNFAYVAAVAKDCQPKDPVWTRDGLRVRTAEFKRRAGFNSISPSDPEYGRFLECVKEAHSA